MHFNIFLFIFLKIVTAYGLTSYPGFFNFYYKISFAVLPHTTTTSLKKLNFTFNFFA